MYTDDPSSASDQIRGATVFTDHCQRDVLLRHLNPSDQLALLSTNKFMATVDGLRQQAVTAGTTAALVANSRHVVLSVGLADGGGGVVMLLDSKPYVAADYQRRTQRAHPTVPVFESVTIAPPTPGTPKGAGTMWLTYLLNVPASDPYMRLLAATARHLIIYIEPYMDWLCMIVKHNEMENDGTSGLKDMFPSVTRLTYKIPDDNDGLPPFEVKSPWNEYPRLMSQSLAWPAITRVSYPTYEYIQQSTSERDCDPMDGGPLVRRMPSYLFPNARTIEVERNPLPADVRLGYSRITNKIVDTISDDVHRFAEVALPRDVFFSQRAIASNAHLQPNGFFAHLYFLFPPVPMVLMTMAG